MDRTAPIEMPDPAVAVQPVPLASQRSSAANRRTLKPGLRPLLIFGFWTLIGLSFAGQFYISSLQFGHPVSWPQAVAWSLGDWYVWALLSIPILWAGRRFQIARQNWPSRAAVHVGLSILCSLLYVAVRSAVGQWQSGFGGDAVSFRDAFSPLLVKTWHLNLLIYWVIICISHAFEYYRKFQDRELRAADLEKRLVEARLQALQTQLNPHFLFNALHAISNLMQKDVDAADRMIARLGDLLRYTLDSTGQHEVTLQKELQFIQQYLEILQLRFGDRLQVVFDVDPKLLAARVPNLILQPLVENAIRHGIEPRAGPGRLEITGRQLNEQILLQVRDNGTGIAPAAQERIGLSNTRARLQQLYPGRHEFERDNLPEGGLQVSLRFPLQLDLDETHNRHR